MKKNVSHYSELLNTPKNETERSHVTTRFFSKFKKALILSLISIFALTGLTEAQTSAPINLATRLNEDKTEVNTAKANERAIKEEKREVKELNNLPESIVEKFQAAHPDATNVVWSVPGPDVEVDFTHGNHQDVSFYNYNSGKLVGTGHYLSFDQLPANAVKKINEKYAGYTPLKVMYYDDNEDNSLAVALEEFPIEQDSYLLNMKKGNKYLALQVSLDGAVTELGDM